MRPFSLVTILLPLAWVTACSQQNLKPAVAAWQPASEAVTLLDELPDSTTVESFVEEDVWLRILDSFQLDLNVDNERLRQQRDWYIKHPEYMKRVTERARPYLYYIAEQIEAREVPGEVALLPIVESAFDPFAYSHGRASGVWQFIPSTGKYFGLNQDWWYDGRRDIRAATNAALDYLSSLARQFDGDWQLALASYNSGAGTVRKAIRQNKAAHKPEDFWALDLPTETQAYVPKLLALAQLLKYPERYQIPFQPVENKPYFAVVQTGGQIDLAQVADLSDTDLDEIYRLNPGYNRWATHPDGPHEILVPQEQQAEFQTRLASLPASQRVRWHRYTVKSGDNLQTISNHYRTTIDVVKRVNSLSGNTIRVGQTLLIPGAIKGQDSYSYSLSQRMDRTQTARQPANTNKISYQVASGDTFWEIGKKYGVTSRQIAHWNGMAPGDPLTVGKKLTIWIPTSKPTSKPTSSGNSGRQEIRKVTYRVRSGDSLASIGSRFRVSVADIRKWNPNDTRAKYLQPGMSLLLYVNVVR
ncbi:lytic transglycosylase [Oceanobacter mangrovi]|uniref:lytic transglycosylase n=1 Tax=Oceanobacter mangrovi TaxID=2862510 RepID=UPI001C8D0C26|nr:LysM peptidoglycan-binding domain-containing protein [Oceanobacter mangrovi]